MNTNGSKTLSQIRVAAKKTITRLYESSPPKDAQHLLQHHAMAHGMIILWAELTFETGGDHAAQKEIQGELEALVESFDASSRQRLGLPVLSI